MIILLFSWALLCKVALQSCPKKKGWELLLILINGNNINVNISIFHKYAKTVNVVKTWSPDMHTHIFYIYCLYIYTILWNLYVIVIHCWCSPLLRKTMHNIFSPYFRLPYVLTKTVSALLSLTKTEHRGMNTVINLLFSWANVSLQSCTKSSNKCWQQQVYSNYGSLWFSGKVRGWNQYPPTVSLDPIHQRPRNTPGTLTERWQMDPSCPRCPPSLESMSPWCRHLATDIYIFRHGPLPL